jgi:hypothetical protein
MAGFLDALGAPVLVFSTAAIPCRKPLAQSLKDARRPDPQCLAGIVDAVEGARA